MDDCIFCKIVKGEFNTEFLFEDDLVVAFRDIEPQAPDHILIIPRAHYQSIKDISDESLIARLFLAGNRVAEQLGIQSFRYVINTGEDAGQAVFHIHLHLLAGRKMAWPPG
jgi:histidine triad (HIT) family protein